jgi:hypothetical protein
MSSVRSLSKPTTESSAQVANESRSLDQVKEQMGEVLDRIRSKVGEINSTMIEPTGSLIEFQSDLMLPVKTEEVSALSEARANELSVTGFASQRLPSNDELAAYKSRILAVTKATEAKARESEEKFTQIKKRLETETELRLAAEKRLEEIEIFFNRQKSTIEYEEIKRASLEEALRETQNTLALEMEARKKAEKARDDATAFSGNATITIQSAKERRSAAEAEAAAALELSVTMEARAIQAEASARKLLVDAQNAEKALREIENLVYESERIADEAQEKCKQLESRLAKETEMRQFAEQQLKALMDELNIDLEVDWAKLEADLVRNNVPTQQLPVASESADQLQAQIEIERKARLEAENSRSAAEKLLRETKTALAKLEEKRLNAEIYYKNLLEQKTQDQEKVESALASSSSIDSKRESLSGANPAQATIELSTPFATMLENSLERRNSRVRVLAYASGTVVLFIAIILLSIAAYNQL